jgi:DNA-binding transcriptional LysR family regulator
MKASLRALRYLVATAEAGNITQAARKLNVSQPSVSAAIAQIEANYGVQVFIRHHARGVTLTSAGQSVVMNARLLLNHARDFDEGAVSLGTDVRGEITIGCFTMLATRFMPGLLSTFGKRHPGVSVQLEEGDQQEILRSLLSGHTEIAMSYGFALPPDIVAEKLIVLPPYAVISAQCPLAARKKISLHELANEPFLLLDLPHSREYFFGLFSSCGLEPRIAFRSRSYELIRGLVGHGHGFTIQNAVPRTTAAYDGSNVTVLPIVENLQPVRAMRLHLRQHTLRPAAQAFWNFLGEAFSVGGLFDPKAMAPPTLNVSENR